MTTVADTWRRKANAPVPGTSLGPLADMPDHAGREFRFGETRVFSMLVVRRGDEVRGYLNLCPHQFLPLTYRSDGVVSGDAQKIVCSNHQAEFAVDDGCALSGPIPEGCALTPVPLHVDAEGLVRIGVAAESRLFG
jgi:nitrite reductase/ring-hydroxylating ferredoxin subunit